MSDIGKFPCSGAVKMKELREHVFQTFVSDSEFHKEEEISVKREKTEEHDIRMHIVYTFVPQPDKEGGIPQEEVMLPRPADMEERTLQEKEMVKYSLMAILVELNQRDDTIPFRSCIDELLEGDTEYLKWMGISHSDLVDLPQIKMRLQRGKYTNPLDFCQDMWLMFENAWKYHPSGSEEHDICTEAYLYFTEMITPVMRSVGYCCGQRQNFAGPPLQSDSKPSSLASEWGYFSYEGSFEDCSKYLCCEECGIKWHEICTLHSEKIFSGGFICDRCRNKKRKSKPRNKYTARKLHHCKLSEHIEARVNRFLNASVPMEFPVEKNKRKVMIRVLASSNRECEVMEGMKTRFCGENGEWRMAEKFPYREKAVFAFEVIDGVEVCFFGFYVQEYGSNCPPPNTNCAYISFLDSIHYFRPVQLCSYVCQQILLGYLDWIKHLGYRKACLWSCAAPWGYSDYIFNHHPPEQNIPDNNSVHKWCRELMNNGVTENIVTGYKNTFDDPEDVRHIFSPRKLQYFQGDCWPLYWEYCIRDVDSERAARKAIMEEQKGGGFSYFEDDDEEPADTMEKEDTSHIQECEAEKFQEELIDLMMSRHVCNTHYYFIELHSAEAAASLGPIVDLDPLVRSEIMDDMSKFRKISKEKHWEFNSLRKAKYSTMMMCRALHKEAEREFMAGSSDIWISMQMDDHRQ